jgi:rhamnose utilization protein RhaD (predicted bifunctional aldolase and dehydrogenase)
MQDDILSQLITMSHNLGDPALDYAILSEGNTSARADADTFWVKASGTELRTIDQAGFVRVSFERSLAILNATDLTDEQVKQRLNQAKSEPAPSAGSPVPAAQVPRPERDEGQAGQAPSTGSPVPAAQVQAGQGLDNGAHPSVETVLHAICLRLEGVNFIGHTHPTATNALTCSAAFETAVSGRLFPDEIVICGPAPVVVPYTDPGVPLARKVRDLINQYLDEYYEVPKVILMQNHGLIALGRSAQQVENITAMAVKTARVLLGTYALGGPHFMSPQAVDRIHTRPDELYRRKLLGE